MSKRLGQRACVLCPSSDALQIYESDNGEINGFCFSCSKYVGPELLGEKPISEVQPIMGRVQGEIPPFIRELSTRASPSRGITSDVYEHYGVRMEVSTADGVTVVAHYYPYTKDGVITGYKRRLLPKDFTTLGDVRGCELFGQVQARAAGYKRLYITEGEEDACALWQSLRDNSRGTQWAQYIPAVVSLSHGAATAVRNLSDNLDFIRKYEQVVLVFDQDDAGKKAAQEVLKLLPTALIVELDEKDANGMLLMGKGGQLAKACLFNARVVKPASVVSVADVFDRAIARPVMGLSWPWQTLTQSTYGIHRGMIYTLGSGVGMGKTEWSKELEAWLVKEHKIPVGGFHLEEGVGKTLKSIAGKIHGKMYHRPDVEYTDEEIRRVIDELRGKVFLYDHMGVRDWVDIRSAIRYLVVVEGIKDIVIDNLTALVAHVTSAEGNDLINTILSELSGMVHELDFSAYLLSHLNVPQGGPPHEAGGEALESQLTGSRAAMRWSNYIFMLQGNKSPELPDDERNTRQFVIRKDREFGNSIKFPIYYNSNTGVFLEPRGLKF